MSGPWPGGLGAERLEALAASSGHAGPGPALEAAHQIARRTGVDRHDLLVVLGSGAEEALADWGESEARLPLSDLPGVSAPVAPGHLDLLSSYRRPTASGGRRVLVAHGRTHLYEGRGPAPVVALARAAAAAGVRAAVLINAGGCLREWGIGEVMVITDHLNLTGASPFDGTVFIDVRTVWDAGLARVLRGAAQREGVYAALRGPEYQTMAEARLLAGLGADCVGMSTVLEAIALHQLGVAVSGLSVVSDLSFAVEPTDPQEVLRLAAGARPTLVRSIEAVLEEIGPAGH
ncbi:purine-nucleoside phosphorylase [Actinomyces slackii]|uniref:purine-nucleoside phosphorylase n=1 Tax=Actinomyces slackii TaxID=52774 RepID=A0A448KCH0_9ACTO|nr:purine-nucleoside phosphorylase [Actinomyces slackii]VEG74625.1 Purine nucleoside phosphorylase [Actinomyces slackii]